MGFIQKIKKTVERSNPFMAQAGWGRALRAVARAQLERNSRTQVLAPRRTFCLSQNGRLPPRMNGLRSDESKKGFFG